MPSLLPSVFELPVPPEYDKQQTYAIKNGHNIVRSC